MLWICSIASSFVLFMKEPNIHNFMNPGRFQGVVVHKVLFEKDYLCLECHFTMSNFSSYISPNAIFNHINVINTINVYN